MTELASPKTLAVLISGGGSNMQALADSVAAHKIHARIGLVVSNRDDAKGLQLASAMELPTQVIRHQDYATPEAFDLALGQVLEQLSPDLIVLAGFMHVLGADLVRRFAGKILNIHPALLPAYKGLNTHQRVLDANESHHGCSVHFVTEELDAGPLVMQAKVPVYPDDVAELLAQRVLVYEHIIYPEVVRLYCANRLYVKNNLCWFDGAPLKAPLVMGENYAIE